MSSTIVDDAFERLYRHHVRDVYRFALALLRNPSEAEDVTQTTFLNAYRAMEAGEEPRRPQNWLLTIAHNTARSRVRLAMRRPKEVPLDDVVNQLAVPEHERTNVRELLRALGRLPFNQRAAITMRELEGRSYPEIAETLGVTVPAVEALLTRARKTLRMQAAAIRGLTVVGLPRSLRRLLEHGDTTAGGAAGAGVVAKAAAVVVAGIAAGGAGLAISEAGTPQAQAPPRPALVRHFALVAAPVVRPRFASHAAAASAVSTAAAAVVRRAHRATPLASTVPAVAEAAAPTNDPAAAGAPAAAASSSAPAAAAPTARHPVRKAVAGAATTATVTVPAIVKSAVPTVPAVPAVPPVTTPPVATPTVPSAPPLPPVQVPHPPPLPTVPDPPPLPKLP